MPSLKRFVAAGALGLSLAGPHEPGVAAQQATAEAIIERHIAATGGRAAHEQLRAMTIHGTIEFAGTPLKGSLTSYRGASASVYTVSDIPGVGKFEEGVSGEIAWARDPSGGVRVKQGQERDTALRDAIFHAEIRWRELYPKVAVTGTETINGQVCDRVVLTPKAGPTVTRFYSQKTGLLVRGVITLDTPVGNVMAESELDDYRKVGAVLVPHRVRQKLPTLETLITVTRVDTSDLPPGRFELPPDVRALVAKTKP